MWTISWWKDAGERGIRAFGLAMLAFIGAVDRGTRIQDINWIDATSVGAFAAIGSLLLSLTAQSITKTGPSFTTSNQDVVDSVEDSR